MKYAIVFLVILVFGLGFLLGRSKKRYPLVAELDEPLVLVTNTPNEIYRLPPGTILYYDHSPKDGSFDVYRVYINVHGSKIELSTLSKPWVIAPLTAFEDSHFK